MPKKPKIQVAKDVMNPDKNGVSDWVDIDQINEALVSHGYSPDTGNGSTLFNHDRGLGKKYKLQKYYLDGCLLSVKLDGIKKVKALRAPREVRKALKGRPCVVCGTSHQIEIDHKDGVKKETMDEEDFQTLCKHCNSRKREVCKKCRETGLRFNAMSLGFDRPVISGNSSYEDTCLGCFWYDPKAFRKGLTL